MNARRAAWIVLIASSLVGLAACAGGPLDASGQLGLLVGVVTSLAVAWSLPARAGAPMPCSGYETTSCSAGVVHRNCCPQGAKCNFDFPSFIMCGAGLCVDGADQGRCPSPSAATTPAEPDGTCKYGGWEEVCAAHHVVKACIMPVPTNYTGPPPNPPFRRCGDDRCTTHALEVDCHPTRTELWREAWPAPAVCDGSWAEVCLHGRIEERCLLAPTGPEAAMPSAPAFVSCPDGSCAVGVEANVCPR